MLHPPQYGGVAQGDATLLYHLHEIAILDFAGDMPQYAGENNFNIKVPAFERFEWIGESHHFGHFLA